MSELIDLGNVKAYRHHEQDEHDADEGGVRPARDVIRQPKATKAGYPHDDGCQAERDADHWSQRVKEGNEWCQDREE